MAQSFQMNKQIKGVDLPSQIVSTIDQDKDGRIWFTTAKGVFYSDGISTYGLPEELSDNLNGSEGVEVDDDGQVWVYAKKGKPRIYKLIENDWDEYPIEDSVKSILESSKMKLYVSGGKENKLLVLSGPEVFASSLEASGNWTAYSYDEEEWGGLKSVFCCTADSVLFLFGKRTVRLSKGKFIPFVFHNADLPGPVWMVRYSQFDDKFYFLGDDYLAMGNSLFEIENVLDQGFSRINYQFSQKFGLQTKQGGVYYFFNSQLYKYNLDNGKIIEISTYDALKSFYITTSFVDRENIIWIGTERGVVNLPTLRFQNYSKWEGLMEHEVSAVLTLGAEEILYGFNNGIQHWKNGELIFESKSAGQEGEPKNRITTFHVDQKGVVWMSSAMKGLGRYDPASRSLSYVQAPDR